MRRKKILIVDDDEDTCLLIEKRLEANGFECHSVSSVEEALHSLDQVRPDLVLLDLMFHGANGTAFLQKVRTTFGLIRRKLPVLVISGLGEQEVVEYVMDIGASGYLHKPIDPEILLSMVREYAVD